MAAGALTVALVVGAVVNGGTDGASAEAAEILNNAAELSQSAVDFDLKPGQYLKVETTHEAIRHPAREAPGFEISAAWVERSTSAIYVPADRNDDWVVVGDDDTEAIQFFGANAEQVREETIDEILPPHKAVVLRYPRGVVPSAEDDPHIYRYGTIRNRASMPSEPAETLGWYREQSDLSKHDPSGDIVVFSSIVEHLELNLEDASTRELLFRTLAVIPGVAVAAESVTEDGSATATLQLTDTDVGRTIEVTIDTSNGLLKGTKDYSFGLWKDRSGIFPKGIPSTTTRVTTTVVDSAP
ncbi:hypothetical protein [Salinibacterium sp. ZJ454]|uniref:hypothetical protein n=1 Tax=Salinibacterium sp. ZJ454 TaxID=2708339 RepID=UPI001424347A|nr:hypothetical protein [Salinibacterium sp. ZJ454]